MFRENCQEVWTDNEGGGICTPPPYISTKRKPNRDYFYNKGEIIMKKYIKQHQDVIACIAYLLFLIFWGWFIYFLSSHGVEWPDNPACL